MHHSKQSVSTQELAPLSSPAQQLVSLLQTLLHCPQDDASSEHPTRRRGHPESFSLDQLWLALLLALVRGSSYWRDVWRMLVWEGVGSFPLVSVTPAAVRQRLLRAAAGGQTGWPL